VCSPGSGLAIDADMLALVKDTLKIDTIRFGVYTDSAGLQYRADVTKKRFRNQEAFQATASGYVFGNDRDADMFVTFTDSRGNCGLFLGINARKAMDGGFEFKLYPKNNSPQAPGGGCATQKPVIAFMPFTVNEDNYVHFKSFKDIKANLRLQGNANSSVWIHSSDDNIFSSDDVYSEIMVEFNQIDLADVSSGFSFMPPLKGILNMGLRYQPHESSFMILGDCDVDNLFYNNGRIGEILLNASYMPLDRGRHQVDMHVFHSSKEVASLSALYHESSESTNSSTQDTVIPTQSTNSSDEKGLIEGLISIDHLPLSIISPFIPDSLATLAGSLVGRINISGTSAQPLIDGSLRLDDATAFIPSSATALRFDEQEIIIKGNNILFDNYKVYDAHNNPFVITGRINSITSDVPAADLKLAASNVQLIDSRKNADNIAYGKLFLDANITLQGALQAMRLRGNLHIPGSTNLTCILADSRLDVQDGFEGLVNFTYFADTLPRRQRRPLSFTRMARSFAVSGGTDVLLTISIDPTVRVRVDLDEARTNHVELRGGGSLSFRYTPQGEVSLNGRYTIAEGSMRYSIPVIPLTDFTIRTGGYIDWKGRPENPYLDVSAYSRVRSTVNFDGQSRMVDFNTGIQMKDNLEDVSVQFLLEAPTDAAAQNQLTAMGSEERSKQAVSLLVAGIYLSGSGTGSDNLNVGAALNSLLQREIKNMLGSLMGEVPFSFDVHTYDGTYGMGRRIDYLGRFYKTFMTDRLKTELGLRYSTKDPALGDRLLLDDISMEYRLDVSGSRSVKIFRRKDYESLFEGEITKTGLSFYYNRRMKSFRFN
ncbi:MAG: translocation/assembly module TamB, partial [Tannerella sp.]|nr:translocation/assembly module TamB [Tannerella sp.]